MRFYLVILASLLAFVSSAQAQEACSVKIIFGSYASGIDLDAYENILALLDDSKEVDTYTDTSWGREGERMICVTTFSMQASDALYEEALRYVPAVSDKSWIEIMHEDGRSQKTQWPG